MILPQRLTASDTNVTSREKVWKLLLDVSDSETAKPDHGKDVVSVREYSWNLNIFRIATAEIVISTSPGSLALVNLSREATVVEGGVGMPSAVVLLGDGDKRETNKPAAVVVTVPLNLDMLTSLPRFSRSINGIAGFKSSFFPFIGYWPPTPWRTAMNRIPCKRSVHDSVCGGERVFLMNCGHEDHEYKKWHRHR